MHNLKTVKSHTLKMHLDRLQLVAESLAELTSGEVMAQRLTSSHELARLTDGILRIRASIESHAAQVRGTEPAEN